MKSLIQLLKKAVLGLALASSFSFGYEYLTAFDKVEKWEQPIIKYTINCEDSDGTMDASFKRAAAQWSDALDNKIVLERDDSNYDLEIVKRDTITHLAEAGTMGKLDEKKGYLVVTGGRISLNSKFSFTANKKDRSKAYYGDVFAHELGHIFGIGHPDMTKVEYPADPEADFPTMHSICNPGVAETLHKDDIMAVRRLYGLADREDNLKIQARRLRNGRFEFTTSPGDEFVIWSYERGKLNKRKIVQAYRIGIRGREDETIKAQYNGVISEIHTTKEWKKQVIAESKKKRK